MLTEDWIKVEDRLPEREGEAHQTTPSQGSDHGRGDRQGNGEYNGTLA